MQCRLCSAFLGHTVWLCLLLLVYICYRFAPTGSGLLQVYTLVQLTAVPTLSATSWNFSRQFTQIIRYKSIHFLLKMAARPVCFSRAVSEELRIHIYPSQNLVEIPLK